MSELFEKSVATIKEGIHSLCTMREQKRKYKEYEQRVKVLPQDYKFVFQKITSYMWSRYGGGNGYDMIALQEDLLELFETGAAEGKHVLSVTGEDVGAFCDELLQSANTYTENWRAKLNREIRNKLENK